MQPFTFFISYRRSDTAPIALLLKNEIEKRMQFVRVSVDVQEMHPGDVFPERLRELINGAHVTIALIGARWMPTRGEHRTDDTDWVVEELVHSRNAPLDIAEADRRGLSERQIITLFADCEPTFRNFEVDPRLDFVRTLHTERINYANWPLLIGPLLDRIAIKLGLQKRPDADEYPDLATARKHPLADTELAQILRYDDFEGWYVDNYGHAEARYLVKTFKFGHFNQAADFMRLVSDHCRVLDHHPEWRNVFNHVTVSLTSWGAKRRVTIYDVNLALYMNMAAKAVNRPRAG